MIIIICALAENNAIGYENRLLYHLRADLQRFKMLTTGHTIIMGHRTFLSLPKGALPNRRNIVLSRNHDLLLPGAEVFGSLQEALAAISENEDTYIIGGESVYAEALPLAHRLCLTHVHDTPEAADAFFPEFPEKDWACLDKESHEADAQNDAPYSFATYERKET